jgi:hypothetical protein
MSAARVALVNLAVLVAMLCVAEVAARIWWPEMQGHVFSDTLSAGVRVVRAPFHGYSVRVARPGAGVDASRPLDLVLGDSISNGYGTAYEDIYWVQAQRLIRGRGGAAPNFVALAYFGNNLADSALALRQLAGQPDVRIGSVLYQFNFNDITPTGRASLQGGVAEGVTGAGWFKTFGRWRYEYLNRSVFARTLQHYAGVLARRTSGTCEQRGLDALGPYTWSFGSRAFTQDAETQWRHFEESLIEVQKVSAAAGASMSILVSPLLFDVDRAGIHAYYNPLRYDFSCATINPRQRLAAIASRLRIPLIDPSEYVRQGFESRIAEGNFRPFYFTADENHFTPVAARYVGEYLAEHFAAPGIAP